MLRVTGINIGKHIEMMSGDTGVSEKRSAMDDYLENWGHYLN